MFLKIYIFLIVLILFLIHFFNKRIEFRKYKELLNNEDYIKFLESRSFEVIDKYEVSNINRFSPPTYYLKLQSKKRKETYEEELEVSLGTYLKTKIGQIKNYDIYNVYGSNEVMLIDKDKKKHFFFDEVKVLLISQYVLIVCLILLLIGFFVIAMFL